MPMPPEFRSRLHANELLVGTLVSMSDPSVAEILAGAGFDWLFIDAEHAPLESADILGILQAVGDSSACIVRLAAPVEPAVKKALDLGAAGIIAPQVNTAEHAAAIVRYARYAPDGARGVGLARAHAYGPEFESYIATANDRIAVVIQAEHVQAVENIESISRVEGLDAVFIGPYDLSASMGKMGQVDDPAVVEAVDHIIDTCQAAGMPIGFFGVSAEAVAPYIERGCTLICAGADMLFLGGAARRTLDAVRHRD